MARLRTGRTTLAANAADVKLALRIGDIGRASDHDLALGWELYGPQIMAQARRAGTRPWGYWKFELGEEPPAWDQFAAHASHAETVRLAELGDLTTDELAAIREQANEARLRIGTDRELISGGSRNHGVSLDAAAVELWEPVSAVTRTAGRT